MVSTEPSDDIGRLRPEFVAQGDRTDRGAVVFDEHDGCAGGLEPLLLPWSGDSRKYAFNGSMFVAN